MTLHQLRIFLAVAQAATLTRASKQLGLAQPSLSKQLAALEENVGARLFERAHKRMVLTDAGRLLLFHAQRVIRGIDEAEAGLREFTSGKRAAPGLYFCGFYVSPTGMLREIGREAKRIAKAIAR